jgi:Protein of unknown function (DUF2939)
MRWTVRLFAALVIAWAAFMVSPFVALNSLARAVEAHDIERLEERVNFRALRISLAKQIVGEYLRGQGRAQELNGFSRSVATGAGASFADPLIAKLVTPAALFSLLDGRLPDAVAGESRPVPLDLPKGWSGLSKALAIFLKSETRGFRTVVIPVPDRRARSEQFRLQMRLDGTTWRLIGLELPSPLLAQLVKQLPPTS